MASEEPADSLRTGSSSTSNGQEVHTNGGLLQFIEDTRRATGRDKQPFIPRKDFHLLVFPEGISFGERNLWKNKYYYKLLHEVAIPNGHKYWYNNIYVLWKHPQLIEDLKSGVYGDIKFISMDQPPREKKSLRYREFIVRGYPNIWELDGLLEYFGNMSDNVHKLYRMKYNGKDSDC